MRVLAKYEEATGDVINGIMIRSQKIHGAVVWLKHQTSGSECRIQGSLIT